MPHVFVYGTLMRGAANHAVLVRVGGRFVSAARTEVGRTLVDLGPYPALLPRDRARDALAPAVHGEVYEVAERSFAELDAFEGCPELYVRERVRVVGEERALEAWVYVLAGPTPKRARVLASGRYVTPGVALDAGAAPSR